MKKKLAIFDLDGTITTRDSFNELMKYSFGSFDFYKKMFCSLPDILFYKIGRISNAKVKTKLFKRFFKNYNLDFYKEKVRSFLDLRFDSIVSSEMLSKINFYHNRGYEIVILSASFIDWIGPWAANNNIDKIICSKYETGEDLSDFAIIEKDSCYGQNKVDMLKREYDLKKYSHIIAFGDSKSDMYFMNLAQEKYMVKKGHCYLVDEYAVITDGLWRKSVSAIRSVGKKGPRVIVTGDTYLSTGMWSKYASAKRKIANISSDREMFGSDLLDVIQKLPSKPVLFPMEESTIDWCSENIETLKDKCYTLLPKAESLKIALSKAETVKLALKVGVNCPKTYFPKNSYELKEIIHKKVLEDYVIKPYHGSGSSGLLYGSESKDIDLDEHWEKFGDLIIQERIPAAGEGVGVSLIFDKNHDVKGSFVHKRLEQYPNSGGPSTQRIGIKNDDLIKESIRLLKALDWVGVAMVEWKLNKNTGKYTLMEINPRFWGSLELAVRCGVDFPFLYYQLSKDRDVETVESYDTNKVCRWLLPGDVLRYLTKKDRESLPKFLKSILKDSEEWDKTDIRCFFASIWCQGLLILNPKYWKYIRR